MVTELIKPVNYNPGRSHKLIKLEISSCRCSQLECNEERDETGGYFAFNTTLLPLKCCFVFYVKQLFKARFVVYYVMTKMEVNESIFIAL